MRRTAYPMAVVLLLALAVVLGAIAATQGARASDLHGDIAEWVREQEAGRTTEAARIAPGAHLARIDLPCGKTHEFPSQPTILYFADTRTLSGIGDILTLDTYASHFGERLTVYWVADDAESAHRFSDLHPTIDLDWIIDDEGRLHEEYKGQSLIVAGDGKIEQAFGSPTRRETRLYLNKLLPEAPFVWEELPLETARSAEQLHLYTPEGEPMTGFTGTVVFLSPYCGGCEEWLAEGNLDTAETLIVIVFTPDEHDMGMQKYQSYWDGRDTIKVALQLGVSPYRVRFPSVLTLAADG